MCFCEIDCAIVSAYAVNMRTGEVLHEENSDKSLLPGSCLKIATTAAALHLLGPKERFQTRLEYDGLINGEGVLEGNLYIKGGGDPCLGSCRAEGSLSWDEQVELWAQIVRKAGIRQIAGKVIGDATEWEIASAVPSWAWEDLGNYYGAGASALSFHENSYRLFFTPGERIGAPVSVLRAEPCIPLERLRNELKTGAEGSGDCACIYGSEFSSIQYIRGTIPLGCKEFSIRGAIADPPSFCAAMLADALNSEGIIIENRLLKAAEKRTLLHTAFSPPIQEVVYWCNQKSINLYAEHLLKKMGQLIYGKGSTEQGIAAVTSFWKSQGLDLKGWHLADGSGLSRKNLITTRQLVGILEKMKESEHYSIFLKSLPKIGKEIYAKSGSMAMMRAYAGYAGDVAFAIVINNCLDPKGLREKTSSFISQFSQTK